MSTNKHFDDYDYEDYKYLRSKKMKTLRNDERYGSFFDKSHKMKNVDPTLFEDEDDYGIDDTK
jgi:hypothetical protein